MDEEELLFSKKGLFEILEDQSLPLIKKKEYLDVFDADGFSQTLDSC